jgi:two-component system chemotaxis response regulator CheB
MQLIPALPKDLPAAVLVVQHMPALFTKSLADRLDQASQIEVSEASDGSLIKVGQALLAPGGYHMVVSKGNRVLLNQDPPVLGVRPSVDITMKSVAEVYRASTIAVVLTGMGSDGTVGASCIKAVGGKVLAEDKSTCAVYGMPQSVFKSGCVDQVLPLPQIAPQLIQMCCKN